MTNRPYISLTAIAALMVLAGCGGSSSSGSAPTKGRGHATLKVIWPERAARLIPNAANSLVVVLSKDGSTIDTKTIARPASGSNQTQTDFTGLDVAAYDVKIKAYPDANGTGVAQASGAGTLNAAIDGSGTVTVSLASTVSTVEVTPAAASVTAGGSTTLTASAKDDHGNLVLLSAGGGTESVTWSSDAPGVATVSGSGLTATFNAVSAGSSNVKASIVVDDSGTVKSGSAPMTVTSASAPGLTGNVAWTANFFDDSYVPPTIGQDGSVYGGGGGQLGAYDGSGHLKWSFGAHNETMSAGLSPDGQRVYVGLRATDYEDVDVTTIYALDLNGQQKWNYEVPGRETNVTRLVTDSAGSIYFGTNGGHFIALNPNGTLKWSITPGYGQVVMQPVVAPDGTIYTGAIDGKVYAVRPDGTIKWSFLVGGNLYTTPLQGPDGTLYVGAHDNSKKVFAINANGTQKWVVTLGGMIYGQIAMGADGTLYAGGNDNKVYALNPSGTVKWTFATSGPIYQGIMIDKSGAICALQNNGTVYGIKPDGTQKWQTSLGGNLSSQATMGPDGRIYVNLSGGRLVALG